MKRRFFAISSSLVFMACGFCINTYAQADNQLRLHVPFDFSIRGEVLPSGNYLIQPVGNSGPAVWRFVGPKQSVMVMRRSVDDREGGGTYVTFNRYGDRYFVTGFQTTNYKVSIRPSRLELAMLKKYNDMYAAGPEKIIVRASL